MKYRNTRIACYTGYVTQAIVVNLAPLLFVIFQNAFDFSLLFIAAITLITFLLQMGIDLAAIYFVEKTSYRVLSVASQGASFVGLILLSVLPYIMKPELGVLLAVFIYSTGSGLCEVVLSPLIESIPLEKEQKGSSMTLMHSFYAWGQAVVILFTTIILHFIGDKLWWVIPLIWSLIPLFNMIAFLKVPLSSNMTVHDDSHGIGKMLKRPEFIVIFVLMICSGASEQAMAQWASMFAEKGLEVTKVVGDILGPCTFAVMMGIGRTLHGLYGAKINMAKLLLVLSLFTLCAFGVCVFSPVPFISLLACGLSGIGVSIMWPGMLAYCSSKYPRAGASMFAILALGGDIGCSLGPWVTGTVSDIVIEVSSSVEGVGAWGLSVEQIGLRCGFLSAVIFPLVMLLGVITLLKTDKKND